MKKILVISGSPRKKGNTMRIVRIIEEEMKSRNENIEFRYLMLKDKNLKFCMGCMDCIRVGGAEACPLKDDALDILEEMRSADGFIFASPGYSHSVSALYKNFMDRFMYLDHLPEFYRIPALIVSTVGGDGIKEVPRYMKDMGINWWGCQVADSICIPAFPFFKNAKAHRQGLAKIKKASDKFASLLYSEALGRPPFRQYLLFLYNKIETEMDDRGVPGRYYYWKDKGWLESDYYYPVKLKFHFKIVRLFMTLSFKLALRFLFGSNYKETISDFQIHEKEGKY